MDPLEHYLMQGMYEGRSLTVFATTASFRNVTLSSGTSLFLPVVNSEFDNLNPGGPDTTLTEAQLRAGAAALIDDALANGSIALTVGYSGSSGVHIIHQEEDTNEVPASLVHFDSAIDSYIFPLIPAGTKAQTVNPNYGNIRASDWNGQSNYHGFQANLLQQQSNLSLVQIWHPGTGASPRMR